MDWGPIWPIDNFKGHKVKKKLALAGLGAPSEITFEPSEIKMSNFRNQSMLANPILRWKEKKIGPKNLAKFGQIGKKCQSFAKISGTIFDSKFASKFVIIL